MTDFTAYLRLGVDSRDAVTAQKNLNNMAGAADKADRSFSVLGAASKVLGAALGAVGAGKVAGDLIEVSRQTGILRAGLETATGSAEGAQESFKAIAQLATQLPESVNDVTIAFTKLVNYGLDPSQAAIKSYSNTASALGKDLTQMIEAVADAATGEFERLKEFGIKSKKEGDNVSFTFRGVTTTVKNSAEEIEGYLQGLGNVQFAGAAEKQMASLDGAISNLGDSYDGLLRSISDAGAGDFIASSIRSVSDAMGEITAMIESGQLGALFDAYIGKFQGFMDAGVTAFEIVSIAWKDLSSGIDGNVITDAFVNMPENIKAFVQIAVVELATLYDKAKIYLNPKNWVGDQSFDELFSGINMAREESITQILAEREAAIKSFDDQVTAANDLRAGYDLAGKSVVDLGQYAIKAGEQSASSMQDATKEAEKYADAVSKIQQGEFADLDRALGAENKQWEDLEKQQQTFDSLIKSVDDFGGAWSRTGSIVADSLGSIVDVMDDYMSKMDSLVQAEADVAEARKIANSPKQLEDAEKAATKLSKERTKTEIASYRSIAGAAASMFKENSKGRKAFHAIEMALSAVELAMSIKSTAQEIAMSFARGSAAATEGVANQAKGDPYTAWARMAAMAAVMAGLGFAVAGGGGGGGQSAEQIQESQGTGSVLGSNDKSASIANSMDAFTDIGMDQLVELRGIRENLAKFEGGIAQLSLGVSASGLAEQKYVNFADQNVGMIINQGLITRGSRSQDVAGRQMLAPLQSQISDIFGFINDSINSATGALEIAQANPAWAFMTDIGKVSFKDMSAEEIQQELNAILSQQADLITGFVVPAMKDYQQMGEGLFETLTRVAKEQAVFNDYMDNMGLSMAGVSSLMAIDMAQSIAAMMGGFENFADKASEYVDRFFNDEEKFGMLQKSLTETFGALGVALPDTTEGFRSLVEGVDRTTESGRRLFAALLEINPAFADYAEAIADQKAAEIKAQEDAAKAAEAIAKTRYSLEIDLLKAQGNDEAALAVERQRILDGLDESLRPLQQEIWATTGAIKAQEQAQKDLADAAKSTFSALSSAVNAERSRIESIVNGATQAKSALDAAISAEKTEIEKQYSNRIEGLKALAAQESEIAKQASQSRIDRLKSEQDAVKNRVSAMRSLFDSLSSASDDIALQSLEITRARRASAVADIDAAIRRMQSGQGFPVSNEIDQALQSIRDNPSELYKSAEEMAFETAKLQNKIAILASGAENQLTTDEKLLASIERQISGAERLSQITSNKYDAMIAQAEAELAAELASRDLIAKTAQDQLDKLTGIDSRQLSVEEALIKYNESILAADFENAQGQYVRLDEILSTGQSQLNSLLSIDDRILSVSDGVNKFVEAAAQSENTNKEMLAQMQRMADEITQLREEQRIQALAQQSKLNETARNTLIMANPEVV